MLFYSKKRIMKLKDELRAEMLPGLIEEAKELARKEIIKEETSRRMRGFVRVSQNTGIQDPNKVARVFINKVTDLKHLRNSVQTLKAENAIQLNEKEIEVCKDTIQTLLDRHLSKSRVLLEALDDSNKQFILEFDSLKLNDSKTKAIVYKDFVRRSERQYNVINSLKYYYRPYISVEKNGVEVLIKWGLNLIPSVIKDDKYLLEIYPLKSFERELSEEDLETLDGSILYTSRTTAKVQFLGLVLTVTFKGEEVEIASLHVPGGIDKVAYGRY